ncbi:hypothetical protein ACWCQQ_26290 [Streptomyces sp. NPDC002143]
MRGVGLLRGRVLGGVAQQFGVEGAAVARSVPPATAVRASAPRVAALPVRREWLPTSCPAFASARTSSGWADRDPSAMSPAAVRYCRAAPSYHYVSVDSPSPVPVWSWAVSRTPRTSPESDAFANAEDVLVGGEGERGDGFVALAVGLTRVLGRF